MATATIEHEGYVLTGVERFPAMKRITSKGSGSVPKELRGLYTSFTSAKNAIDQYKVTAKGKKNASKKDTAVRDEPVHEGTGDGSKPS